MGPRPAEVAAQDWLASWLPSHSNCILDQASLPLPPTLHCSIQPQSGMMGGADGDGSSGLEQGSIGRPATWVLALI